MSLHIECGQAGRGGIDNLAIPIEITGTLAFTETVTSAGTSTNAVPSDGKNYVLTLTAEVDMFFSIGASPNASTNPRRRLKAGCTRSFAAQPNDKVAWV